jgi:myosin heavy subunit
LKNAKINGFVLFLDQFLLDNIKNYRFLSNGYIALPGVDDVQELQNTIRSMQIMNFQEDEIAGK